MIISRFNHVVASGIISFFFFFQDIFWHGPFLKSLLNLLQFGFLAMRHVAPRPGLEHTNPILGGRVLTTGSPGKFLFHSFLWLSSTPLCKCTSSSLSIHLLRDLYKVTFHEMDIKISDKLNWAPTHFFNQRSTQPHLLLTQHARNVLCLPWPSLSAHAGPIDMSSSPVQGPHSPGFEFNSTTLYLVWPLTNVFFNKP